MPISLYSRFLSPVSRRHSGALLDGYETTCRPAARANADESFGNMMRLGEIGSVIGSCPDLAALERRLASPTQTERAQLGAAVEAQRSHFLSDGWAPEESAWQNNAERG